MVQFALYALLVWKCPDKCFGCMVSVYKPLSIGLFTMVGYISVKYYSLLYSYWIYGEIIFALCVTFGFWICYDVPIVLFVF